MKRIFYLLVTLIVITGCEATYNIDIDDNFNESLVINPTNADELSRLKEDYFPYPSFYNPNYSEDDDYVEGYSNSSAYADYDEKNDSSKDEEDDNYITLPVERYSVSFSNSLRFSYKFGENYEESSIANTFSNDFGSYNSTSSFSPSKIYAVNFSDIFTEYPNLSKLTINIRTNKEVITNNADKVDGNVYTWVITKKNSYRDINITYSDDRYFVPIDNPNYELDPVEEDPSSNIEPDDDPNNGQNQNPNNNKTGNKKTTNKSLNEKQSKVVLYVLYSLFFGLIFVIIIFRTFKKNIKIKK